MDVDSTNFFVLSLFSILIGNMGNACIYVKPKVIKRNYSDQSYVHT